MDISRITIPLGGVTLTQAEGDEIIAAVRSRVRDPEVERRPAPETGTIADRVEARLRTEWPGTPIPSRPGFFPPEIREGGGTDTFIKLMHRIITEETPPRLVSRFDLEPNPLLINAPRSRQVLGEWEDPS